MNENSMECFFVVMTLVLGVWGQQGVDRQYKCDWQLDLVNRNLEVVTRYVTPDESLYEDITTMISNVDLTPDDSKVVSALDLLVNSGGLEGFSDGHRATAK